MCPHNKSFENTVGKGEIAHNRNFSSSHSVFYLFEELSAIFNKSEIVICKLFLFGRVQNLSFGTGLNSTQHFILSKPLAAFPLNHCRNNGQGLASLAGSANPFSNKPWLLHVCSRSISVGKGEIDHNKWIVLSLQCFLPFMETCCHFHQFIINCLHTLSGWKSLKFVIWKKG